MSLDVRAVGACRVCGGALEPILDLGTHALPTFPRPDEPLATAPLVLVRCGACTLVQLGHTVNPDSLYRTYHYRSSMNETMVEALRDVVRDVIGRVALEPGDAVVDVGSNDNTLLRFYPTWLQRVGFEPSRNIFAGLRDQGILVFNDYFPPPWPVHVITRRKPKIITSIAMFYDLEDPNAFCATVKDWLHPEGVWIVQFQDWALTARLGAFDNVCHEHLLYLSRCSMAHLLARHGLAIDTWRENAVNGGSLHLVIRHADRARNIAAPPVLTDDFIDVGAFTRRVERIAEMSMMVLEDRAGHGQVTLGIGASTKFGTLSQYLGLTPRLIQAVGDRNPDKHGRIVAGTGIPIVSEEEMRDRCTDFLYVGAWQFADAFTARERALVERGVRFYVPLPHNRWLWDDAA